jgi:hypothetical protein
MSLSKHIENLCHQVSQEADGDKLLSLVDELNKELERAAETPAKDDAKRQVPASTEHPEGKSNAA